MANRCRQCGHASEQAGNCPVCNIPMIDEVKMQMPGGDQPAVTPVPGQPKPGEGVTPQMPQTDTSVIVLGNLPDRGGFILAQLC